MTASMSRPAILQRVLLASAALALLAAAVLVLQLQRVSARRQQQQETVVVQQLCRQTAMLIAERVRESFGAAVLETLEGIGHPELHTYNLPRIVQYFDSGRRHLYVGRFFVWSAKADPRRLGAVLFYRAADEAPGDVPILGPDGESLGFLYAAPQAGELIWAHALRFYRLKRSFAVVEEQIDGRSHQVVIHYIWADGPRSNFVALVGYTVDLARVRARLFPDMFHSGRLSLPRRGASR